MYFNNFGAPQISLGSNAGGNIYTSRVIEDEEYDFSVRFVEFYLRERVKLYFLMITTTLCLYSKKFCKSHEHFSSKQSSSKLLIKVTQEQKKKRFDFQKLIQLNGTSIF